MSRSRRKTSITGNGSGNNKWWKKKVNKGVRQREKQKLNRIKNGSEDEVMPKKDEISTEWDSPRDGKHYFDEDEYPEEMWK